MQNDYYLDKFIANIEFATDGKKQYSTNGTFTVSLKNRLSDLILEHCVATPKSILVSPLNEGTSAAPKTLNNFINCSWRECKREFHQSGQSIKTNDIVMAKMRTFSAWPGRLTGYTKDKKRAHIRFFGTHDVGSVDIKEIVPFNQCQSVIKLLLVRQVGPFHKGILEIEAILNIPPEKSLLNEYKSLL